MSRTVRLVVLTNDAFGLAAGNFNFPIYSWEAVSQSTQSISSIMKDTTWQVRVRTIQELIGLNPEEVYTTLPERLSGLPRGYSWKIAKATCLYEDEEAIHILEFVRDTIHQSFSTEEEYQDYITRRILEVWNLCEKHYEKFKEIDVKSRRPSLLVLEKIDGSEELARDRDVLIRIISSLWSEKNPLSKKMYEIVWQEEVQRGTWEYSKYG